MAEQVIAIQGAKAIEAELKEMGRKAAGAYVLDALKEGGRLVQGAMVADAPEKTGKLRRAIRVRTGTRRNGQYSVKIGFPRSKVKASGAYYGGWQDEGWSDGPRLKKQHFGSKTLSAREDYRQKSLAAGRKFHEGKHFVERGWDQSKNAAEGVVVAKLQAIVP